MLLFIRFILLYFYYMIYYDFVIIVNILFTKQESKLVTYVAGPVKSTVDYIMARQEDKAKRFVTSRLFQVRNMAKA